MWETLKLQCASSWDHSLSSTRGCSPCSGGPYGQDSFWNKGPSQPSLKSQRAEVQRTSAERWCLVRNWCHALLFPVSEFPDNVWARLQGLLWVSLRQNQKATKETTVGTGKGSGILRDSPGRCHSSHPWLPLLDPPVGQLCPAVFSLSFPKQEPLWYHFPTFSCRISKPIGARRQTGLSKNTLFQVGNQRIRRSLPSVTR